ncbi:hypothetical protein NHQ30_006290 [Ciborinia camelliae]|nr:hypothetical protein NHQ30_006290 [Ciborinia camelliae]
MAHKVISKRPGDVTLVLPSVNCTPVDPSEFLHLSKIQEEKANRFEVSSKIMMANSSVFKALLDGQFQEAETLEKNGSVEIPLDDDPIIMKIFVSILHGRWGFVPQKIDLSTLAGIAILFDKYQLRIHTNRNFDHIIPKWTKDLSSSMETFCHTDGLSDKNAPIIFQWICIAWVFELEKEFNQYTNILLIYCTPGSIQRMLRKYRAGEDIHLPRCLPTPCHVFEKARQATIEEELIYTITVILDLHRSGRIFRTSVHDKQSCDIEASEQFLKSGLYPLPEAPYSEWSLQTIRRKIESLNIVVCPRDKLKGPGDYDTSWDGEYKFKEFIRGQWRNFKDAPGLRLADLKKLSQPQEPADYCGIRGWLNQVDATNPWTLLSSFNELRAAISSMNHSQLSGNSMIDRPKEPLVNAFEMRTQLRSWFYHSLKISYFLAMAVFKDAE